MAKLHPAIATVSYSRISSHESCARQFWHQYVDKTPPDGYDRIEGWMGRLVHEVLEGALRATLDKQVPDPSAVLADYEAKWDETFDPAKVIVTKDGRRAQDYRAIGRACLATYLGRAWPFLKHTPVAVEAPIHFDVDVGGARARFIGYADRIDREADGRIRIVDYKTGAWEPDHSEPGESRQLALYWNGLRHTYADAPGALLVWHYLQNDRVQRVEATSTVVREAVAWLQRETKRIAVKLKDDDSKRSFPTTTSPLCRWCSFGYVCGDNPFRDQAPLPSAGATNTRLTDF